LLNGLALYASEFPAGREAASGRPRTVSALHQAFVRCGRDRWCRHFVPNPPSLGCFDEGTGCSCLPHGMGHTRSLGRGRGTYNDCMLAFRPTQQVAAEPLHCFAASRACGHPRYPDCRIFRSQCPQASSFTAKLRAAEAGCARTPRSAWVSKANSTEGPRNVFLRLPHRGIREHLLRLAVFDQLAEVEESGLVRAAAGLGEVVRDDDDRVILLEL
jgi:hypothetical protein